MTKTITTSGLSVALVTPAWPGTKTPNGIATAVTHLAAGLKSCGHRVTIIALTIDGQVDGARVIAIPDHSPTFLQKIKARFDPWGSLQRSIASRIATALHQAIRQHGVEVVVMEETFGWAGNLQKSLPIPVVATLHGPWFLHKALHGKRTSRQDRRREESEYAGLRIVSGITSPSLNVLQLTRQALDLPDVPQAVIRNPMPLPPKDPNWQADRSALERVLFVGRFDYHKGGDVVIEAFGRLAALHSGCHLTFVGPGNSVEFPDGQRIELASLLDRLPAEIRQRIEILGPCDRERVAALRETHAITIVASRYENFGGTMTEAMAAGSALVCTNVGGCPEMIEDGSTGLLVPPDEPEALAQACLRLLQDQDLVMRLGIAARKHIEAVLAPEVIAQELAEFLAPICRR